jgi:hypothetical protein
MALSYWKGTGDGATTNYSVPFPYLDQAHVFVSVAGVDTAFTWLTSSTIQISPAPALAAVIKIYRKTSPTTALVTFTSGFLPPDDLNTGYLHDFYLAQESNDTANDALTQNSVGKFDALSKEIVNVATPTTTSSAVPKSYLDAIVVAAANVPTPVGGDAGKFLKATGAAAYSWQQIVAADVSGLGTSATVNTGTSGATIPLLNGNVTFSGNVTFNTGTLSAAKGITVTTQGVVVGAPTGGDKGSGTINTAGDHYKNGVLVRGNRILVQDQKASTTAGGTATSGAWQTRTLNTEVLDEGNDCTLVSNQITLAAGTYDCRITSPAGFCGPHQARLRNVTDSTTVLVGTSEVSSASESAVTQTISTIVGRFTIAASKALEVQHRVTTTRATDGFGTPNSFGEIEVYVTAEFVRVS